ncbi:MAG TPA: RNA polymerase sigma factor [Chromatiales bacterium]|nr:RNA polymerase sigma factor [Chromatiales bacterium]
MTLDQFLAGVEGRALVMAETAVGDREEALDLVQEAMTAFVRRYASRDHGEWGALFHRILQNRIRDWHRRNRVRNRWRGWLGSSTDEREADPIQQAQDTRSPGPLERIEQSDAGEVLVEALKSLPLRQQQAFMLRVWEGLDVADTARAMGCSGGSVKTHLSRALAALRERLRGYWP